MRRDRSVEPASAAAVVVVTCGPGGQHPVGDMLDGRTAVAVAVMMGTAVEVAVFAKTVPPVVAIPKIATSSKHSR